MANRFAIPLLAVDFPRAIYIYIYIYYSFVCFFVGSIFQPKSIENKLAGAAAGTKRLISFGCRRALGNSSRKDEISKWYGKVKKEPHVNRNHAFVKKKNSRESYWGRAINNQTW